MQLVMKFFVSLPVFSVGNEGALLKEIPEFHTAAATIIFFAISNSCFPICVDRVVASSFALYAL